MGVSTQALLMSEGALITWAVTGETVTADIVSSEIPWYVCTLVV
jgi:hypothetical protein